MSEPGLDLHEWQSEWASLEDELADSPENGLRYAHELIGRMLRERGVLDQSLAAREGADPELVRPWEAGADLVRRLDAEEDVEHEEVLEAIDDYRLLFETLTIERAPP